MSTPTVASARRAHLLRRHGIAVFLASALLLWGAGFAQLEDGRVLPLDRGGVVSALAAEAGSSGAEEERLRSSPGRLAAALIRL